MGQEVKNHITCQSKHGLSDFSVKTGKFIPGGSQEQKTCTFWTKNIKMLFGMGHTPNFTSSMVYMSAGGFRGHKSLNRIELSQFVQDLL